MATADAASLDFEGSVVVLVTMLANQISASGSLIFQKRHGLTSIEWKTMATVAAMPGSSGSGIAQVLSLDKAAVSRTVGALSERGLLTVQRRKTRGNQQAITLSPRGDVLHREALATAEERERCLLARMTPEERGHLHDLLRRMIRQMPEVFQLAPDAADVAPRSVTPAPAEQPAVLASLPEDAAKPLHDRIDRLESLLADLMLENTSLRRKRAGPGR